MSDTFPTTYREIIGELAKHETCSVIFSNEAGRISAKSRKLTGIPGLHDGPEVFFLVEPKGKPRVNALSIREALWHLGITGTDEEEDCA